MGVVYRATQLSLNRSVALKILSSELGDDESFRERFRREGLLQAAIDHPHIVTVYDTGETEHGLFLAMRMVRGPTLKDMILARELDPARTLRILNQVAEALDTAHDVGLTHRDIKPQNILIGSRDHAYLADFGLTKAPDEAGRLTATGQFVGTIDYVSPEQIQGESATALSDVYALTGVLYECLVGTVPFPKPAEAAVVYAHISEPPPRPTAERPELPAAIDEVVAKGMAKDPAERFRSAGELQLAARRAFGEQVRAESPPGPIAAPEEAGLRGNGAQTKPAGATLPSSPEELAGGVTAASPVHKPPAAPTVEAAGAAVPAAGAAEAPAKRKPLPLVPMAAALGLLAVVAGFAIGSSGSDSDGGEGELTSSASAGSLQLSFPGGWQRTSEQPRIAGMTFAEPIVLSTVDFPGARLIAGQVEGSGPTLLPSDFIARLPSTPSRKAAVKLGRLEAFRYDGLPPRGTPGSVTLFTAPTSEGVATVACVSEPTDAAKFTPVCERVAGTVELTRGKPFAVGPRAAYARPVGAALRQLESGAKAALGRAQGARTASAQGAAASAIAKEYSRAASSVAKAPAGPYERAAGDRLVRALRAVEAAYARAGRAARRGDRRAYGAAGRSATRAGRGLQRALNGLEGLGYRVK